MKLTNKTKSTISAIALAAALLGANIRYTDKKIGLNENSPLRPKIEINEKYKAQLINLPHSYNITIFDEQGNHYIMGEDVNKDTIIDNIYKNFDVTDSILLNLTSSEELSKIEKELLEKK
jgi:hypothetical protein